MEARKRFGQKELYSPREGVRCLTVSRKVLCFHVIWSRTKIDLVLNKTHTIGRAQGTAGGNWTFATYARGTLLFLLARENSPDIEDQNADVRAKEKLLKEYLRACFRASLLPVDWSIFNAQKTFTTHLGVNAFHKELQPYSKRVKDSGYKKENGVTITTGDCPAKEF
ncbi:hypothetical protein C8F04DRAFT_1174796 [Mycena alexandri]|uniref:Uncharacterized protein n=1 Tax=Mycena alexandri TaxID=1745969 RepID=A0AAD6XGF8_9AGAR|nr:hypothetical protein C8F04DRAFT_1174796 [Mycena alexandri]